MQEGCDAERKIRCGGKAATKVREMPQEKKEPSFLKRWRGVGKEKEAKRRGGVCFSAQERESRGQERIRRDNGHTKGRISAVAKKEALKKGGNRCEIAGVHGTNAEAAVVCCALLSGKRRNCEKGSGLGG